MKKYLLPLCAVFLFACENRNGTIGLEEIEIDGAEQAFCAFEDERVKFVMLPTFDWTAGRLSVSTSSGNMEGAGAWTGEFDYQDGRSWSYEVSGDAARFGNQHFHLEDGEVFLLSSDLTVHQIRGTKAGRRRDKDFKDALAELLKSRKRTQESPRQPANSSESKPNVNQHSKRESEGFSRQGFQDLGLCNNGQQGVVINARRCSYSSDGANYRAGHRMKSKT